MLKFRTITLAPSGSVALVWPAVVLVLMIALYHHLRFGGWWNAGNDTRNFTIAINTVMDSGALMPSQAVYSNGYGFQALSTVFLNISGVNLADWQLFWSVILIAWIVFPAWLLYREWVGSSGGALLATVLLFIQPDFLFAVMRGTHEKFTQGLVLLCLFLLTYSLRSRSKAGVFAPSLIALYLAVFALITFNSFFASLFVASMLLALGLIAGLALWTRSYESLKPAIYQLGFAVAISVALLYIHVFYLYPPTLRNFATIQSMVDQIAALLLGSDAGSGSIGGSAGGLGWVSPYAFLLLGVNNWLLFLGAGSIWTWQSVRWFLRGHRPSSFGKLLPWAFFGATALIGVFSAVSDASGALSSNLQHRILPSIGIVGAALIARWLIGQLRTEGSSAVHRARVAVVLCLSLLFLPSLLKATNEPLFSNQWQTHLPAEVAAIDWAGRTLTNRSVWTGFDRRMVEVADIRSGGEPRRFIFDRLEVDFETRDFVISDLMRLQVARLGESLPTEPDDLVTYDNGYVQVHHRRPDSPYHR